MAYDVAFLGGKARPKSLASLASQQADLRRETTAWAALVWAYADEQVRAATNGGSEPDRYCSNGLRLMRLGETGIGAGAINGVLDAHPDALGIHGLMVNWFDEWPDWLHGAIVYAERRTPPPPVAALQRFRIVGPELTPTGDVRVIWKDLTGKHNPWICPLVCEGFEEDVIKRHGQFMIMFDALLEVMMGLKLNRWKITSKGY